MLCSRASSTGNWRVTYPVYSFTGANQYFSDGRARYLFPGGAAALCLGSVPAALAAPTPSTDFVPCNPYALHRAISSQSYGETLVLAPGCTDYLLDALPDITTTLTIVGLPLHLDPDAGRRELQPAHGRRLHAHHPQRGQRDLRRRQLRRPHRDQRELHRRRRLRHHSGRRHRQRRDPHRAGRDLCGVRQPARQLPPRAGLLATRRDRSRPPEP